MPPKSSMPDLSNSTSLFAFKFGGTCSDIWTGKYILTVAIILRKRSFIILEL